jgi:hypothetical protein
MRGDNTQWVCKTQPVCKCSSETDKLATYSCYCDANPRTHICRTCLVRMVFIDVDSGKQLRGAV